MRSIIGVCVIALVACEVDAPRMQAVASGDRVVARFDPPIAVGTSDKRWIALVREGSTVESERVFIDEGAREAALGAPEPGTYELVLHQGTRIVARARVTIERTTASRKDPPIWYW
jgi:hypothetical protein